MQSLSLCFEAMSPWGMLPIGVPTPSSCPQAGALWEPPAE